MYLFTQYKLDLYILFLSHLCKKIMIYTEIVTRKVDWHLFFTLEICIATNQFFSSKFPCRNNNKYVIVQVQLTFHNSGTIGTSKILLAKTTWGQILVLIQCYPKHSHQVYQWSKSKLIFWLLISSKFC